MKRRGFLGMLAGLIALPGAVIAAVTRKLTAVEVARSYTVVFEDEVEDLTDYSALTSAMTAVCRYCQQRKAASEVFMISIHASSCSNQNVINSVGAFAGTKDCGCATQLAAYCAACLERIYAEAKRIRHEARFVSQYQWFLKDGDHLPKFERSCDIEVTRARIQHLVNELQGAGKWPD